MSFWDWVKPALPVLIGAGATIYGANLQSKANNQAAQIATTANQGSTDAQLKSIDVAEKTMQTQQRAASPGLIAIQNIIGRGSSLTPEQQIALDDARRTTLDSLGGSGVRGSARATVAAVNDVEGRMRGGFLSTNQAKSDQAASNLSGQYFNAGNNIADLNLASGKTVSQGLLNSGDINAANTMGQATLKGTAIGDIGAVIADQIKASNQEKRDSSYQMTGGGA